MTKKNKKGVTLHTAMTVTYNMSHTLEAQRMCNWKGALCRHQMLGREKLAMIREDKVYNKNRNKFRFYNKTCGMGKWYNYTFCW